MKKLFVLVVVLILVGAAAWAQDVGLSMLGKWQLTTQFYQWVDTIPYRLLDGKEHPFISGLMMKDEIAPEYALEIQNIEFIENGIAILTTTRGVTRAFYEFVTPGSANGSIRFKLQGDDLFGAYFIQIDYAVVDEQLLRFSYLVFIPSPASYNATTKKWVGDISYYSLNLLGEMKRLAK
jgi:hypothetical protein